MEDNNFHPNSAVERRFGRLRSRVPTVSISNDIADRNPICQPMCEEFSEHERQNDVKATVNFMIEQVANYKECSANSGFGSQQMDRFDECNGDLTHSTLEENDKKRSSMNQQMSVAKKSDTDHTELVPQNSDKENGKIRDFMGQEVTKPKEHNAESSGCMGKERNMKSGFMSQQMDNTEGHCTELLESTRKEIYENSSLLSQHIAKNECGDNELPQCDEDRTDKKMESSANHQKRGKYFYYDSPLYEETGVWIPVSVPPMSESEHQEWTRGFRYNGGYFPEGDLGCNQYSGEDKELTMWDVVVEMLLAARGKMSVFPSGNLSNVSWISNQIIEQGWKEIAQTLTEANFGNIQEILEAEPPKWLPDSAASSCMLCSMRFHPIMCSRHHCRFCGGIFCSECTKGRSLLPEKFRVWDPQRVCDVCCVRLESVQPYLMDQVSRASRLPTHDLTDLSTLRSWVNFPWGQSMEYEIYKASNTIKTYIRKVGFLGLEKSIPDAILRHAKGLAILTVVKVGVMVTYSIGTGLVVVHREDGSWSPPSAISSFGVGWGAQAGGELTDLIIVLRTNDAIRTFSGDAHLSIGAGLSAAAGIVGRTAGADVRTGIGTWAPCYTYSCSKGAFIGCSLEGSIVTTRARENSRFYGRQAVSASDILLGLLPRPPAAAVLYSALLELYQKLER